jgi:hypothetical protein
MASPSPTIVDLGGWLHKRELARKESMSSFPATRYGLSSCAYSANLFPLAPPLFGIKISRVLMVGCLWRRGWRKGIILWGELGCLVEEELKGCYVWWRREVMSWHWRRLRFEWLRSVRESCGFQVQLIWVMVVAKRKVMVVTMLVVMIIAGG